MLPRKSRAQIRTAPRLGEFLELAPPLIHGFSYAVHEFGTISKSSHVELVKEGKRRAHHPLIQLLCRIGVLDAETATTQKKHTVPLDVLHMPAEN